MRRYPIFTPGFLGSRLWLHGCAVLSLLGAARAEPPPPAHPLAVLQRNCLRCHTEDKRKGGLVMASREAILKGGESGAPFDVGQSGGSLFIGMLHPEGDPHMPPKGQLSPVEISVLEEWIDAGAPWDDALWKKLLQSPLDAPVTLTALPPAYRPVFAVALAPDGKTLAAGRGPRIEWLAIATTGDAKKPAFAFQPTGEAEPGPDPVQALAWSPDGKTLAAGSFRRIVLFDTATRAKRAERVADLRGRISALAFTPDSKTLLAADSVDAASGRMLIIESASARIAKAIDAHRDTIFALSVSPDGKLAATASADKSAKVWDLATGQGRLTLEGHTGYVLSTAFSPTGDRLATGGDDEAIKIWLIETGKQIGNFGGAKTGPVTALAWAIDPKKVKEKAEQKDAEKAKAIGTDWIAAANEAGQPRVYADLKDHEGEQTSTGARERSYETLAEELTTLALDPATLKIFSGSIKGTILGWDDAGKIALRSDIATPLAESKP